MKRLSYQKSRQPTSSAIQGDSWNLFLMPNYPSQVRPVRSYAVLLAFSFCTLLGRADFGGTCYNYYNILATTCDEVESVCTSNYCSSHNGYMSYSCYTPYSCSGSYTVPAATTAAPSSSSSDSNVTDNCNSMSLSSCSSAEMTFKSVGCTCYSCVETNGNIEASCTAPIQCTPLISTSQEEETSDTPNIGDEDYGIVCAVFIATAIILSGSTVLVARLCFPVNTKELSIKQTVTHRMSIVTRGLYTLVSFESFVEDDGASVSFTDYLCDKNELFGLIDWRKKTAAVRPRWMRASAIAAAFLVTLSLAFLLGTVVYNNESCQSVLKVEYCHVCSCETYCDGARIGCTDGCQCRERNGCSSYSCSGASSEISTNSATETSTYACQSADVKTSSKAYYVTMFLTMVMSKANSIEICSVDVGSSRQKLLHLVTVLIGIALVGFGIIYSNYLSKEDAGDPEASSRRQRAISQTLFTGWWYDQVANLAMTLAQFVVFGICYNTLYSPKVEEVKYAGAAAVHPHKLDANIMKTDDVKGDKGEPVVVEEVKLQPPTQQHQ